LDAEALDLEELSLKDTVKLGLAMGAI